MSTAKASNKKRRTELQLAKSDHLDLDLDLSKSERRLTRTDLIRTKRPFQGEPRSVIDELKSKVEKDRQGFAKSLSKSSKECENCLKTETAKFQALYEKFCKDQANHL
ncbi:hypothetical protein L3X38_000670 [Prunus dulcis]|uniref:Uncharacterized protein n=1 Tax=Prunus dulcis TaxID=3755 RepID=A0AAD4ZJL6_PRUDU|nr:hypothetical protein L3X38_000670 [Prunus dulcis]